MAGAAVLLCLFAALPPLAGLVLARRAVKRIDATPHAAGRGLARPPPARPGGRCSGR
ncbi:MAG: hypothetical protein U0736_27685 [Gemmataceae bacterium]